MFRCWMSVYQFTASRSGRLVVSVLSCGYGAVWWRPADGDWTCSETQTNLETFQSFGHWSWNLRVHREPTWKPSRHPQPASRERNLSSHFPKAPLVWSLSRCCIRLWKFQAYFGLMCWTWHVPAALWLLNLCWEKKLDCSHRRRSWGGTRTEAFGGGSYNPLIQDKIFHSRFFKLNFHKTQMLLNHVSTNEETS